MKIPFTGRRPVTAAPSGHSAFTLIELLVVVAIISILAAILFPVFGGVRERARTTSCLSNMKQIGTAVMQYAQDYDQRLPFTADSGRLTWTVSVQPYLQNTQIFRCKSDISDNWADPATPRLSSYFTSNWFAGQSAYTHLATINSAASVIYLSESAKNSTSDHFHPYKWVVHDPEKTAAPISGTYFDTAADQPVELNLAVHQGGFNNLYADGHAKWGQWSQLWFGNHADGCTLCEGAFDPRQ